MSPTSCRQRFESIAASPTSHVAGTKPFMFAEGALATGGTTVYMKSVSVKGTNACHRTPDANVLAVMSEVPPKA